MLRRQPRQNSPPRLSHKHIDEASDLQGKSSRRRLSRGFLVARILAGVLIAVLGISLLDTSLARRKGGYSLCSPRTYPPHGYFKMNERPLPSFLAESKYMYGEFPTFLSLTGVEIATRDQITSPRICVHRTAWWKTLLFPFWQSLPFADGTNPSILRIKDNRMVKLSVEFDPDAMFLATVLMTNSQCAWKDSAVEVGKYPLSPDSSNSANVRTVFLVLDESFQVLEEATIKTYLDGQYGHLRKPWRASTRVFSLEDAHLFTNKNELWVSYRDRLNFGEGKQVINRVHLSRGGRGLQVMLKASEVEPFFSGGDKIAFIDNVLTYKLHALTSVDPLTVVNIKNKEKQTDVQGKATQRRLSASDDGQLYQQPSTQSEVVWNQSISVQRHRRLMLSSWNDTDFRVSNGFMVYLPHSREYLGIGRFRRPPVAKKSDLTLWGHHFTHSFFTISDHEPFRLKRMSPELVVQSDAYPQDAEVIQVWSGLERIDQNILALSYGINDCEVAATYLNMKTIDDLLREVPKGVGVSDLILPLKGL